MSITTVFNGSVLTIPGAYTATTVQNTSSALATTGILMLVGEADSGARFDAEESLDDVSFGPDQLSDVIIKYKSGPIVDAFRSAIAAASDPQIQGSFNRCIVMKTNEGTKASSDILAVGGGPYGTLYDVSYGKNGNLINWSVEENTAEIAPTTGPFTLLLPIADYDITLRVDGGAVVVHSSSALETPTTFVAAVNALTGIDASGGADRGVITVAGTLAVTATGNDVVITRSIAWAVNPVVGDTLYIAAASVISGGSDENAGSYVVTSVSTSTVGATKLRNETGSPTVLVAPISVGAQVVVSVDDLTVYSPVTISYVPGDSIPGLGKTLEINDLTSGTDLFSRYAYDLSVTQVDWLSASGSPVLLSSSAEYGITMNVNRQFDQVSSVWDVDGQVALNVGYTGDTCAVELDGELLTFTVVGGSGADLEITLADFPTISDLAVYIDSQTGYSASVENAAVGQLSPSILDVVSTTGATTFGNEVCRIKVDAYNFNKALLANNGLIQLNDPSEQAEAGLPDVSLVAYLSGGLKGSTSDQDIQEAIDELEGAEANFLIPLFSRDAADDIIDGLTDSSSSYEIDAINAYAKSHVLLMSQIKRRRQRQAFVSKRSTFSEVREAASNLAEGRVSMTFQDMKDVGSTGIVQFQPWMSAVKAASMQAAAFYRGIFNKGINCSGILQAAGDYKDTKESQVENALNSGLLPGKRLVQGGFTWVKDQTTYTRDDNFVFNSIQAIYAMDTVARTIGQRMEQTFVGQSLAEISAGQALSVISGICFDLLRQKLIAPSDGFPAGFKDASIRIQGPVMYVNLSVFLATLLYFIPINIQINQVTQTASL